MRKQFDKLSQRAQRNRVRWSPHGGVGSPTLGVEAEISVIRSAALERRSELLLEDKNE